MQQRAGSVICCDPRHQHQQVLVVRVCRPAGRPSGVRASCCTRPAPTTSRCWRPRRRCAPPLRMRRRWTVPRSSATRSASRSCSPAAQLRPLTLSVSATTQRRRQHSTASHCCSFSDSEISSVKAKFHYTGPTGPARTRADVFARPGSPTKSADFVWSGPCSRI